MAPHLSTLIKKHAEYFMTSSYKGTVRIRKSRHVNFDLYTTERCNERDILAMYPFEIFDSNHTPHASGMYLMTVYDEYANECSELCGDVSAAALGQYGRWNERSGKRLMGKDGKFHPTNAFFSNEPNMGQRSNCELLFPLVKNPKPGDIVVAVLRATRPIASDKSLIWCYGNGYYRDYDTGCGDQNR